MIFTLVIRHKRNICDVFSYEEQFITILDLKSKTAEELMIIYQQNSPEEAYSAFCELYFRFNKNVFSYLIKKCRSKSDAEDLLQKVFMKVHESKHLYKKIYKFEQWLFVIARTTLLDHFRATSRYENRIKKSEFINKPDEVNEELSFPTIDADQKELLEMKFVDELSYQEIARLLNKSEMSLRKVVSRLMINLRKGDV